MIKSPSYPETHNPVNIGDLWRVWWETPERDEDGNHWARIIDIRPYKGRYQEYFTHVLDLYASNTKKGYHSMTVNLDKKDWREHIPLDKLVRM